MITFKDYPIKFQKKLLKSRYYTMRSENSHAKKKKKSLFEYWQLESTPNRNLIEELTF